MAFARCCVSLQLTTEADFWSTSSVEMLAGRGDWRSQKPLDPFTEKRGGECPQGPAVPHDQHLFGFVLLSQQGGYCKLPKIELGHTLTLRRDEVRRGEPTVHALDEARVPFSCLQGEPPLVDTVRYFAQALVDYQLRTGISTFAED